MRRDVLKMRSSAIPGIAVVLNLVFAFAFSAGAFVPPKTPVVKGGIPYVARVPVLVELFTAEGCSICPPADDLLRGLEQDQAIPGVEVIALEMHVDYWNGQGWRDPFASRQLTNRQNDYLRLFRMDNVYTPQMVIGGQTQVLGSDRERALKEIARAARSPRASVDVSFQSASVATVRVDRLPSDAMESEIWLAVTESNNENEVGAGDNSGRTLKHTGVVRSLVLLGRAEPGAPTVYSMHMRFNPRWKREDLKYVVFVQERLSRKIWGAAAVAP
jgi:hypothetical protein